VPRISSGAGALSQKITHLPRETEYLTPPNRRALLGDSNSSSKGMIFFFCMLSVVGRITIIIVSH